MQNVEAYSSIRDMILANEDDVALLKKVNRLTFGLMVSKEPETTNNNNQSKHEQRMD